MVVLSAGIVSSSKILMARQFVEMTRLRVEGLLGAFSKLVDSGRDHTFIETETVRYVYQPMESLYLLLVTNKSSNILEDLETLRLLAKVVQDCCQVQVNEEAVLKHCFDLVFAFDEVISFGHRESVTLAQIKTYTEMDSHEEKLYQMLEQSKINEAREMAKQKQHEIAKLKASQPKDQASMPGISADSISSSSAPSKSPGFQESMSMSNDSFSPGNTSSAPPWATSMDDGPATIKPKAPQRGMALTKKKPGDIFAGLSPMEPATSPETAAEKQPEAAPVVNPLLEPVKVEIEEKVTAKMQLEGGLVGEAECTGSFQVTVLDTSKADLVAFQLNPQNQDFKYKTHPNLNKASYANNILEVRDASKAFKANLPAPLVKWRLGTTDDGFLPVSMSCWPTSTADGTQIVLELEMTDPKVTLENVHVRFPAPPSSRPAVASAEPGEAQYDGAAQQVHWFIPMIDDGASGTLEFSASCDAASLLPFMFEATRSGETMCPMAILECYHMEKKDKLDFALQKSSSYSIVVGN